MKTARVVLAFGSALFLSVACGPPPAAQSDPASHPAGSAPVVVVPPEPTASVATDVAPAEAPKAIPSRPASAAGNLDECIARLRDNPGSADPSKMGGEADYRDGLSSERSGTLDRARKAYLKLVRDNPQSTLIPGAYFAFGEMFMAESAGDPTKLAIAEQAYREVIKYPPPENKLSAVAQYRLGVIYLRNQPVQALASFSRAAKADQATSTDGCAVEVAAAALTASVSLYADIGEPSKCWSFYLSLTSDGKRAAERTMQLSEQYVTLKKGPEAAACLAASLQNGAGAQKDEEARKAYCSRARGVAAGVRVATGAPPGTLDKQIAAACP